MCEVNKKKISKTLLTWLCCLYSVPFFSVSIVDFDRVFVSWALYFIMYPSPEFSGK